MRQLTGFLHFLQSSGSGQSELLWPSWRQLKHSGSSKRPECVESTKQFHHITCGSTLTCPSLRHRRHTSGSGQSHAMCTLCGEVNVGPPMNIVQSHLLGAVTALVISTSYTTSSKTVPEIINGYSRLEEN